MAGADELVHQQGIALDGINPEVLQSSDFGAHGILGDGPIDPRASTVGRQVCYDVYGSNPMRSWGASRQSQLPTVTKAATLVTKRPTEACAALVGRNNCPYHRDGYGKRLGLRNRGILMV